MTDPDLRLFEAGDWPGVYALLRRLAAEGDAFTYPRRLDQTTARSIWLRPPPGRTLVVVDPAGQVLASATMGPNQMGPGSHVATASFAVDAAHRGRGLGRRLLQEILRRACDEGYSAMQFNAVVETNTHALALWTSEGFQVIGRTPAGFRHATRGLVDLLILHRRLPGGPGPAVDAPAP